MKLVIQIPCLNEEENLPQTLADLPRELPGIDSIEILIIDDGSTDRTVEVAIEHGADHVISLITNRGLATAWARGVAYARSIGADMVVNTDADNQYCGEDIAKIVAPVVAGRADVVVGSRPVIDHPEFGPVKKVLQLLGSWVLRKLSRTVVPDAASGFRCFSREACQRLFIYSNFSYCMETLIQAGNTGLRVMSVPIRVNLKTRDSRLFRNITEYVYKQAMTMLSLFALYRPGMLFFGSSLLFFGIALVIGLRFLALTYWLESEYERTYIPSLIVLAISATLGSILSFLAVVGLLLKGIRMQLEAIISHQRVTDFHKNNLTVTNDVIWVRSNNLINDLPPAN